MNKILWFCALLMMLRCFVFKKLRKAFGKLLRSQSEFLSEIGEKAFPEYVFERISASIAYGYLYKLRKQNELHLVQLEIVKRPVLNVDQVDRLWRVKDRANFISLG